MDSLFTPWRTPRGNRFLLAEPPWTRNTLLMWDSARDAWDWPTAVPMLLPMDARDFLERAESAHVRHGFYVLPCWKGLYLPKACPSGVALDLQACFLCSCYPLEVV
ncbi:hypothetical protein JCM15519_27540 [Fundidesulfovibrio butyratiphilus]